MISLTSAEDSEAPKAVAASILSAYGIADHDIKRIAYFLHEAKPDRYWKDEIDDLTRAECSKREDIIIALERLTKLYRDYDPGVVRFHPETRIPLTPDRNVREIEYMLAAEKSLQIPPPRKARNRPVTAKNAEAETIFRILLQYENIDAWRACGLIAEMFIRLGIENKPCEKVKAALYDKLSRSLR